MLISTVTTVCCPLTVNESPFVQHLWSDLLVALLLFAIAILTGARQALKAVLLFFLLMLYKTQTQ